MSLRSPNDPVPQDHQSQPDFMSDASRASVCASSGSSYSRRLSQVGSAAIGGDGNDAAVTAAFRSNFQPRQVDNTNTNQQTRGDLSVSTAPNPDSTRADPSSGTQQNERPQWRANEGRLRKKRGSSTQTLQPSPPSRPQDMPGTEGGSETARGEDLSGAYLGAWTENRSDPGKKPDP